jgi:hypothetical protein
MDTQPQTVDAGQHQAIVAELIDQRDKALAESANRGVQIRMLQAQMQQAQQAEPAAEEKTPETQKKK